METTQQTANRMIGSTVQTTNHENLAIAFHNKRAIVEDVIELGSNSNEFLDDLKKFGKYRFKLRFQEPIHWHGENATLIVPPCMFI